MDSLETPLVTRRSLRESRERAAAAPRTAGHLPIIAETQVFDLNAAFSRYADPATTANYSNPTANYLNPTMPYLPFDAPPQERENFSLAPTSLADDVPNEDFLAQSQPAEELRKRNLTLPVLAAVAAISLVAGLGLSRLVFPSTDATPAASLITVPIEERALSNEVSLLGEVRYDETTDVVLDTAELAARAVVTGTLPQVGSELTAGSVALEISGRPVIALPGSLPTFRTLRIGMSGPDVVQLKQALAALGINAGNASSDLFDENTAAGVAALYRRVGYSVPPIAATAEAALTAANQRVTDAQNELTRAQSALAAGNPGPSELDIAQAETAINAAQRTLELAQDAFTDLTIRCSEINFDEEGNVIENEGCSNADFTLAQHAIDDANDALTIAWAARDALDAAPVLTTQQSAVTAAQQRLTEARTAQTAAQRDALPHLPASEVLFFESLPRRVNSLAIERGETVGASPVMTVSGSDLLITAAASAEDAESLSVGQQATVEAENRSFAARISALQPPTDLVPNWTVVLTPQTATPAELAQFNGDVRVTVPLSATRGDVLTVPLAALSAGPNGESRIEVKDVDGQVVLVEVTTGMAAGGHVEVQGVERTLLPGELVVIGTGASGVGQTR